MRYIFTFRHRMLLRVKWVRQRRSGECIAASPRRLHASEIDRRSGLSVWTLRMTLLSLALVSMRRHLSIRMTRHAWVSFAWCATSGWGMSCYSQRLIGSEHWYKPCAVFHRRCIRPVPSHSSLSAGSVLDIWKCESSLVFARPALAALAWTVIALQCWQESFPGGYLCQALNLPFIDLLLKWFHI